MTLQTSNLSPLGLRTKLFDYNFLKHKLVILCKSGANTANIIPAKHQLIPQDILAKLPLIYRGSDIVQYK